MVRGGWGRCKAADPKLKVSQWIYRLVRPGSCKRICEYIEQSHPTGEYCTPPRHHALTWVVPMCAHLKDHFGDVSWGDGMISCQIHQEKLLEINHGLQPIGQQVLRLAKFFSGPSIASEKCFYAMSDLCNLRSCPRQMSF